MGFFDRFVCAGLFDLWSATQKITHQLISAEELLTDEHACRFDQEISLIAEACTGVTVERARAYYESARERQSRIEDKAKINLLGLSLAVSAFFAGAKFVTEVVAEGSAVLVLPLGVGVGALLAAWWVSMWALCLRRRFQMNPELESRCKDDPQTLVATYVWMMRNNELVVTAQANAVHTGFGLSFRGIFCLSIFVLFATVVMLKRGGSG